MITIIWGRDPNELIHEQRPTTEAAAKRQYRELIATHYAALMIDGETVAHNLERGPVVGPASSEKDSTTQEGFIMSNDRPRYVPRLCDNIRKVEKLREESKEMRREAAEADRQAEKITRRLQSMM